MPVRKLNLQYTFSVEGETEKWYLEWLARKLNERQDVTKTVSFIVKVQKNPVSMVKRFSQPPREIFHLCDIESQDPGHVAQVEETLRNLKRASSLKSTKYLFCYSNFTFELWMILHKQDCFGAKTGRADYLKILNRCYRTNFASLPEYKEEKNFRRLLDSLSVCDVVNAVERAERIMKFNEENFQKIRKYGYGYFRENPSLELHTVIARILKECGLV